MSGWLMSPNFWSSGRKTAVELQTLGAPVVDDLDTGIVEVEDRGIVALASDEGLNVASRLSIECRHVAPLESLRRHQHANLKVPVGPANRAMKSADSWREPKPRTRRTISAPVRQFRYAGGGVGDKLGGELGNLTRVAIVLP